MKHEALNKALEAAGGQTALAALLEVSQQRVWGWVHKSSKGLPAEYVLAVEKATGVSRHDLRPDVYPLEMSA
ncbi:helix-turn-helix domain-containing protein [Pararhizobium gei]|uniref:helix-turn-helix domain-containing protein n=1 Tax=Pararhizobium gei TaxID=1395951 RepID=UPI0023DB40FB|nr:helix-turn-helix domain-containing protein [Rhizobium gei]